MNLARTAEFITEANSRFERESPETLLMWAIENYPTITLACSFGAEDVVLVHMLQQVQQRVNIFYLDTNFHFQETYETRDRLAARYNIHFQQVLPEYTPQQQAEQYGEQLWKTNPDQCCHIRKVLPLARHLSNYDAWITGIRREQSLSRADTLKVDFDSKFGLMKFNPIANWTNAEVWQYIQKHDIPYNPLHDHNYPSIGCLQCTRPIKPGEDLRAGRWSDSTKTECGLHQEA